MDKENLIKAIVSFIVTACFFLAIYKLGGIWFETNDDVMLSEMLSGKVSGTPEFHCPYVGALITLPITWLYRLFHGFAWWGGLIFSILICVVFLNFYSIARSAKSIKSTIAGLCLEACLLVAGIHCFGQAQYTSAAILLAVTGYIVLITGNKKASSWILFMLLELLSCSLRGSSMILVQPMGIMVFFGGEFTSDTQGRVRVRAVKRSLYCICLVMAVILMTKLINVITFKDDTWKEYLKYNDFRTYLTDYETPIEYETVSNILTKYDISEEDFKGVYDYRTWYADNKFTGECLDELLPVLKGIRTEKKNGGNFLEAVKQLFLTSSEFWHLHQFTAAFFVLSALLAAMLNKKMLISVGLTFGGYFFGLVILAYRNRFVLRVMQPYYLGTLLLLGMILIRIINYAKFERAGEKKAGVAAVVLLALAVLASLQIGRVQFSYFRRQNNFVNVISYSENREIMDYCRNHPDKHFVLDMSYAKFVSTDIFETGYYDYANHIYSGTWYSNMPPMYEYCKEYVGNDCYYLVYEAQEYRGREGVKFYADKMGTEPQLEEKFKLSSGATMWVYHISGTAK